MACGILLIECDPGMIGSLGWQTYRFGHRSKLESDALTLTRTRVVDLEAAMTCLKVYEGVIKKKLRQNLIITYTKRHQLLYIFFFNFSRGSMPPNPLEKNVVNYHYLNIEENNLLHKIYQY